MSTNEDVFGPIADIAAAKYGLDPSMFRNLIRSESSFDPTAINTQSVHGENAQGIAQFLPSTATSLGVDANNPYSALDGAAKYLSGLSARMGLPNAIAYYKGFSDLTGQQATDAVSKILGDFMNDPNIPNSPAAIKRYDSTSVAGKVIDNIVGAARTYASSFAIGLAGLLFIIFSIYLLARSAMGTDTVKTIASVVK